MQKLTLIGPAGRNKRHQALVLVKCSCGSPSSRPERIPSSRVAQLRGAPGRTPQSKDRGQRFLSFPSNSPAAPPLVAPALTPEWTPKQIAGKEAAAVAAEKARERLGEEPRRTNLHRFGDAQAVEYRSDNCPKASAGNSQVEVGAGQGGNRNEKGHQNSGRNHARQNRSAAGWSVTDYVAKANQYIDDVLSGKVIAGKWTRLACQRQRDDLARTDWQYHFDAEAANDVCSFLELLTHVKGEKGGETFVLENWQCFCVTTVFGWKQANGRRRFRRSVIFCGKETESRSCRPGWACTCWPPTTSPARKLCAPRARPTKPGWSSTPRVTWRARTPGLRCLRHSGFAAHHRPEILSLYHEAGVGAGQVAGWQNSALRFLRRDVEPS